MALGDAIGPAPQKMVNSVLEDAVAQVLREKGDSAALIKEAIANLTAVTVKLTAIADQQQSATQSLADAARYLAARTIIPAPEVTVNVPEAPEYPEQETPIVNVTVPEPIVNVTISEPPETEKGTRKRVVRDPVTRLITEIIEEPL